MSRKAVRPYLVTTDDSGAFWIDVRTTRFNSQGYPLISTERLGESFATATKARAYLRETYRAVATDIATA